MALAMGKLFSAIHCIGVEEQKPDWNKRVVD